MPAYLMPQDLEGYLQKLIPREGVSTAMWLTVNRVDDLLASSGTLIKMIDRRTGAVTEARIPTLVPASKDDGSCVHYRDGKCGVHKHSPTGCKMFNACAEDREADKQEKVAKEYQMQLMRTWINHSNGSASEEEEFYCRLWQILWDEGKRRENVSEMVEKYIQGTT
jgi:Fe-S-cluster containining protein